MLRIREQSEHAEEAGHVPAFVVGSLIAISGVVFGYEMWLGFDGASPLSTFVAAWGLVPREFLREWTTPGTTLQVVWLTPITAMFLHAGLLHWVANAVYLWVFGAAVEARMGHLLFLTFYLLCGLAAASVHIASAPDSYLPTIGASGAISGVLGAFAVRYPHHRVHWLWPSALIPAWIFLGGWFVMQIISGVLSGAAEEGGIAWWAHIGGFAFGALFGSVWVRIASSARARARI